MFYSNDFNLKFPVCGELTNTQKSIENDLNLTKLNFDSFLSSFKTSWRQYNINCHCKKNYIQLENKMLVTEFIIRVIKPIKIMQ